MTSPNSHSLPDDLRLTSEDDRACPNCDTPLPMCLYWKMHGYVACCPECKHPPAKAEGR